MNATIYNDTVFQLIDVPCNTLAESQKEVGMTEIPSVIQDSIDKSMKFFLQATKMSEPTSANAPSIG